MSIPLVFLLFCTQFLQAQAGMKSITGIHYANGSAVSILIEDGMIRQIEPAGPDMQAARYFIAPGLIDMQINGYLGVDFSTADLSPEKVAAATKALWKEGVTSYLPTVITSPHEITLHAFKVLAEARRDPETGPSMPGFHLEGPYINPAPGFRGAHLAKYIRPPDWPEFSTYQEASGNAIKLVTVAPEMEGAIPFIRNASHSGIRVSLGHHNGNPDQISASADAGASLATHLGNGCANMINRHHNPLWPQLSEDRLNISIIVDGHHLTREEVRSFYKVKGTDQTILVSDMLDLAGLEPGEYIRGERKVVLTGGVIKFPEENVLAGAASPVRVCIANMMDYTGCSLTEAIDMASSVPARYLGLTDRGELVTGKRADLILFELVEGQLEIRQTILGGKVVYERNNITRP